MIYVIAAWVMLSGVADVITTERALARGARELNPIMRAMQEATGRWWWVGKLLVHAVIAGVVLFLDGGLGVAIGATSTRSISCWRANWSASGRGLMPN